MLKRTILLLLPFFLLLSSQCRKAKNEPTLENELAKLPPATQTGANSFGCLVNGKAWTPKGSDGNKPNFYVICDPGWFGNLDINVYRLIAGKRESIYILCFDILAPGLYPIDGVSRIKVNLENETTNCYFWQDSSKYVSGFLKISKYDYQNSIVAGEFECKLYDKSSSCDTMTITNGRFDYHF